MKMSFFYSVPAFVLALCFGAEMPAHAQAPAASPAAAAGTVLSGSEGWTSHSAGWPKTPGTTSISGSTYTLTGQGYFSGPSDSGQFCYRLIHGDGELSAEVVSVTGAAGPSASGGVMIRAATGPNAQMAYVDVTMEYGKYFVSRATQNTAATSASFPDKTIPYWVKVARQGSSITGYASADGVTWKQIGDPVTMDLPEAIDIGLAATSNGADVVTATFTNVTLK